MAESRSSEAESWRRRRDTGTLSAASVRCPMVPVSSSPWRAWKRLIAAVTWASKTSPVACSGARSSVMASRSRNSATSGPDEPGVSLARPPAGSASRRAPPASNSSAWWPRSAARCRCHRSDGANSRSGRRRERLLAGFGSSGLLGLGLRGRVAGLSQGRSGHQAGGQNAQGDGERMRVHDVRKTQWQHAISPDHDRCAGAGATDHVIGRPTSPIQI